MLCAIQRRIDISCCSVLIGWWFLKETFMRQRWFWLQRLLIIIAFFALYSETLMIPCCFFDGSLKQRSWNTDHFLLTFNDSKCFDFIVLIWDSLMFHWCFGDVLLMLLWGNLYETAMIWMRTKMIIYVFFLIISEYLMFHCCFIEFLLLSLWKNFNEIFMILMQILMLKINFKVLISKTLMIY